MSTYLEKTEPQWQDAGTLLLGVWLFISPWVLRFAGTQPVDWNVWIAGAVIALVALGALVAYQKWEEWVNAALAVWLIISPWALGFSANREQMLNAVIVGALVLGLAFWAALIEHEAGHQTTA